MENSISTLSLLKAKIEATTWFSRAKLRQLRSQDQLWVVPLAALGIAVGAAVMVFFLINNYVAIFAIGRSTGNEELVLFAGLLVAWVLTFVALFPLGLSVFYLARDGRMLLALPIPPGRIVGVNYLLLYAYSFPIYLAAFVPAVCVYFIGAGISLLGIVATAVAMLLGGLLPVNLALLLVFTITRAVNVSKHRVALEASGMGVLFLLLIAFQVAISRTMMGSLAGMQPTAAMKTAADVFSRIERAVFPASWGADAFVSPLALMLFVVFQIAVVVGVLTIVRTNYVSQLTSQGESRGRNAHRATESVRPRRSVVRALIAREFFILTSNSAFLFEAIGEVLAIPLVLIIVVLVTPQDLLASMVPTIRSFPFTAPITLAVLSMMAGFNTVSATSISREGRNISFSLSLPLPGSTQVGGKLGCYFLLFYPAFALNSVIVSVLLSFTLLEAISLVVAGIPILLMLFFITVYGDLRRPLTDWSHPQQAMKQNMNVLLSMGLVILGLLGLALITGVAAYAGVSGSIANFVAATAAFGAWLVLRHSVLRYADRRYERSFAIRR